MTDTQDFDAMARDVGVELGARRDDNVEPIASALRDVAAKEFERGRASREEEITDLKRYRKKFRDFAISEGSDLEEIIDDLRSQIATLTQERDEARFERQVAEGREMFAEEVTKQTESRCPALERENAELCRALGAKQHKIDKLECELSELREANILLRGRACRDIDAIEDLRAKWLAEPSEAEIKAAARILWGVDWPDYAEAMRDGLRTFLKLRAKSTVTPYKGELNPRNFRHAPSEEEDRGFTAWFERTLPFAPTLYVEGCDGDFVETDDVYETMRAAYYQGRLEAERDAIVETGKRVAAAVDGKAGGE